MKKLIPILLILSACGGDPMPAPFHPTSNIAVAFPGLINDHGTKVVGLNSTATVSDVAVTNDGDAVQHVTVTIDLTTYGTPVSQSVTVAPHSTAHVALSPAINWTAVGNLQGDAPSKLTLQLVFDDSDITQSYAVTVSPTRG